MESFRFPEYGHGGDHIGSRRARRAFQFTVAAVVLFTGVLWYAEYFLRYDNSERLYLSALTLEAPSARALLRSAVKQDAARRQYPTPKYLHALAEAETEDQALARFREAYSRDPENAWLAIRLGCRLVVEGLPAEARKRFQEAAVRDEDNALPLYLEAAVLPWEEGEADDLSPSVALISRTNNSERTVSLGRPLWFAGLPQSGYWYADLRRKLVRETLFPIEYYVDFLCARAAEQISRGETLYWDTWLEKVQEMGRAIAAGAAIDNPSESIAPGAAVQALAGISVQLKAIRERERIRNAEGVAVEEALVQRKEALTTVQSRLEAFEAARVDWVAEDVRRFREPMRMAWEGAASLFILWIASLMTAAGHRAGREAWSIAHPRWLLRTLTAAGLVQFALLASTLLVLQHPGSPPVSWEPVVATLWRAALIVPAVAVLVAPFRGLPAAREAARRFESAAPTDAYQAARAARRRAAWSLIRRESGIALGLHLCAVCAWVALHRVALGLYPWQIKLLADGFAAEELAAVREVLAGLL